MNFIQGVGVPSNLSKGRDVWLLERDSQKVQGSFAGFRSLLAMA